MYIDDDMMETGSVVYLGEGWYMDTETREKRYMTVSGELITEKEYQEHVDVDDEYREY